MKGIGSLLVTLLILVVLSPPALAQQPAPKAPAAAQDGFVPVDAPMDPGDVIPAPRLVATAYGFIWVVLFGYLWTVRARLATVEREMASISGRLASNQKRP
jgi:CcmD family protein